ncbi:hypothetical protein [Catenulispora sp. GAS73]|uniref:hypothetical protein n=1 Tax=Catenulispora sp. GAS73 TaxID=3156269 RepID=UPI0035168E12
MFKALSAMEMGDDDAKGKTASRSLGIRLPDPLRGFRRPPGRFGIRLALHQEWESENVAYTLLGAVVRRLKAPALQAGGNA